MALGLLLVAGAALLAAGMAWFTHHRFGVEDSDNPAISAVLTLVGGLQAVLMTFVLIALFDGDADARTGAYREADGLVSLAWSANALPEPSRARIQSLAKEYATTVAESEWPRMRAGEAVGGAGWTELTELRRAIDGVATSSEWQEDRRIAAADAAWDVYEARQARLERANGGLDAVVWLALAIGGLGTVVLTYLFDGLPRRGYLVVTGTVTGAVVLVLFVIFQLQNPFAGTGLDPDAFRAALTRLS